MTVRRTLIIAVLLLIVLLIIAGVGLLGYAGADGVRTGIGTALPPATLFVPPGATP